MSGLGKGIVSSSIGKILQSKGLKVVPIKFDGYLNVDCGTMNPYRHGEVYVLDDGTECDMDFGTYERFLNMSLKKHNSITGGKIFQHIIQKERKGGFLGMDVQVVPHLTNEIKEWVRKVGDEFNSDVVIVEVGGTVGDLENSYFIEAMRQFAFEEEDVLFVQLTYVHTLKGSEQKTKPTQHANRLLASLGIKPKMIICREDELLSKEVRRKISLFCNVPEDAIFDDPFVNTIYELPLVLEKQNFSEVLFRELKLSSTEKDMKGWKKIVDRIRKPGEKKLTIGITGKYTTLKDAYVSIKEALVHAAAHHHIDLSARWIETTELEEGNAGMELMKGLDGIVVPGGFGARGIEGKIMCIKHARENDIPFLGLCLGMQLGVIEFSRNVVGLKDANSTEFDKKTPHPVIDLLPEQKDVRNKGATMRLGAHPIELKEGTKVKEIYGGKDVIGERFRHRYEVNPEYISQLEEKGMVFSGKAEGKDIMQMMELPGHPFFVATQSHPEFKSRLVEPAPLFHSFLSACAKNQK